jgi:hypothetical protein
MVRCFDGHIYFKSKEDTMKFTDRFIKIPIKVYDVKQQELTGHAEDKDSWMKFNPMEVANYKPSYDEGEPETEIVFLRFKSGDGVLCYMSPIEFETLLNEHSK